MLYPLSYGRIVFGAQCTIANYSITASFLQVLYWVDEIKNIINEFIDDNNAVKKDILNSLLKVHDENTLKLISDMIHKFAECENL